MYLPVERSRLLIPMDKNVLRFGASKPTELTVLLKGRGLYTSHVGNYAVVLL